MEIIDLNNNWKYGAGILANDIAIPANLEDVSLPVDLLRGAPRVYGVELGNLNSYYDTSCASFYKQLPAIKDYEQILLEIDGLCGVVDIFVNNIFADNSSSHAPNIIDITKYYIKGMQNVLKLSVSSSPLFGKYTGLGVSGGINLIVRKSKIAICPYGVQVLTDDISEKATLKIDVNIENLATEKSVITLEALIFNARGKRVARKTKRIRLSAESDKIYQIVGRLSRFYAYSVSDPYLYSAQINIYGDETLLDSANLKFGIQKVQLTSKGLAINGKATKLKGAVMAHDNGILGMTSFIEVERYKLKRIKNLGYNAVRYIGCPSDACLDCLDELGLYALIDIFDVWQEGKYPLDGHVSFARYWGSELASSVLKLRNHPSVVMYSIGNNVGECYNRGGGIELAKEVADAIRWYDNSRVITINATEMIPLPQELSAAGIKIARQEENYSNAAIKASQEKDLFKKLTSDVYKVVDVAGYSYLHNRFSADKATSEQMLIGLASYPSLAFESLDEAEKNINVIGDFKVCGADFLGEALGKPIFEQQKASNIPPHASYVGDLDLIYDTKPQGEYRKILMGDRTVSLITVVDPETNQILTDYSVINAKPTWNFSRFIGKPITINVFSGGEVVALYLGGKLIGRKLAGKVNKHTATFKTEYYPGRLEAVSYHKGVECSRAVLESVGATKTIKLLASEKSICVGGVSLIQISICDKDGLAATFTNRGIQVFVSGEGELLALGNGDQESQNIVSSNECLVFEGKALMAVRGLAEGKINIKVFSEGLSGGKMSIKVKPSATTIIK